MKHFSKSYKHIELTYVRLKVNKTYSLNVEVVKAFDEEVEDQTRSRLLEALMIEFLVKYSRERQVSPDMVGSTLAKEEII